LSYTGFGAEGQLSWWLSAIGLTPQIEKDSSFRQIV
jgi:hypothetical protein